MRRKDFLRIFVFIALASLLPKAPAISKVNWRIRDRRDGETGFADSEATWEVMYQSRPNNKVVRYGKMEWVIGADPYNKKN